MLSVLGGSLLSASSALAAGDIAAPVTEISLLYAAFVFALFLVVFSFGVLTRERLLLLFAPTVLTLHIVSIAGNSHLPIPVLFAVQPLILISLGFFIREFVQSQSLVSKKLKRFWLAAIATLPILWLLSLLCLFGLISARGAAVLLGVSALQVLILSVALLMRTQVAKRMEIEASQKEAIVNERNAIIRQVSHDIRSPLSALSMVVGTLNELPESRRLLIRNATQRINDITNDLSKREKSAPLSLTPSFEAENEPQMVVSLIDSIVSEKRLQYREKMDIEIQGDLEGGYGLFVQIHPGDFSRALSNLIDNSIQAVGETGMITISVARENEDVKISVRDNGCGISPEVLLQLGHAQDGDPGVKRAAAVFEKAGASMSFSSKLSEGALVEIVLPRAKTPKWFVKALDLREGAVVVSIDDDQTIHQIWKGRFASADASMRGLNHLTFSSVELFEQWVSAHRKTSYIYLIDYEFLGQDRNGLEVIEKLGIEAQAILVTSRYEEPSIRRRAERLGVRILPKSLAPMIPISIGRPCEKLDAVLIDDDSLVHMSWKMAARAANRNLRVFESGDAFILAARQIDLETPLYIDVNLGSGIKGQDVALEAAQIGFTNIFLATGYDASDVARPDCVTDVVGKDPVF